MMTCVQCVRHTTCLGVHTYNTVEVKCLFRLVLRVSCWAVYVYYGAFKLDTIYFVYTIVSLNMSLIYVIVIY